MGRRHLQRLGDPLTHIAVPQSTVFARELAARSPERRTEGVPDGGSASPMIRRRCVSAARKCNGRAADETSSLRTEYTGKSLGIWQRSSLPAGRIVNKAGSGISGAGDRSGSHAGVVAVPVVMRSPRLPAVLRPSRSQVSFLRSNAPRTGDSSGSFGRHSTSREHLELGRMHLSRVPLRRQQGVSLGISREPTAAPFSWEAPKFPLKKTKPQRSVALAHVPTTGMAPVRRVAQGGNSRPLRSTAGAATAGGEIGLSQGGTSTRMAGAGLPSGQGKEAVGADDRPQQGDVYLDGRLMGRWLMRAIDDELVREPARGYGIDLLRGLPPGGVWSGPF